MDKYNLFFVLSTHHLGSLKLSDQVLAEIARLSGAIAAAKASQQTATQSTSTSTSTTPTPTPTTTNNVTDNTGNLASLHHNSTGVAPRLSSRSHSPMPVASSSSTTQAPNYRRNRRGGYRNQTLVLNGSQSTTTPVTTSTTTTTNNAPRQVVIDGVTFVSDPRGNKLVRRKSIDVPTTSSSTASIAPKPTNESTSTPKRASISGQTYIRTKGGNLVSIEYARRMKQINDAKLVKRKQQTVDKLVDIVGQAQRARDANRTTTGRGGHQTRGTRGRKRQADVEVSSVHILLAPLTSQPSLLSNRRLPNGPTRKSSKLCRFFQKTDKVAICPLFLKQKCPNSSINCQLSHDPKPQRTPHCLYFPDCKNGSDCIYVHSIYSNSKTNDSRNNICQAFSELGWCDEGKECKNKHTFECFEFSEKGICSTKGCKLPHVIRRKRQIEQQDRQSDAQHDQGGNEIDDDDDDDDDDDNDDDQEEEDEQDTMQQGQIDWNATRPTKRRRDQAIWNNTQGVVDELLRSRHSKRFRNTRRTSDIVGQDDYVSLAIPLDDDDDDDDIEEEQQQEDEDEVDIDSVTSVEEGDFEQDDDDEDDTEIHPRDDQDKSLNAADEFLNKVVLPADRLPNPDSKQDDNSVQDEDEDDDDDDDDLHVEQMLRY
ncbi:hypothetical protein OIO90_004020 [Microbotryomycetes sp. JL221]|nr:hypothetical protein OIO90_004020 [Microbotryomycetes sp. JL221]